MNILYVTPYVPNQIRVRPYQLIRTLVRRGHSVTLLAVWSSEEEEEDLRVLESQGVDVRAFRLPAWRSLYNSVAALPTRQPLQSVYSRHDQLDTQLAELARSGGYDIVHIEHLRGSSYGVRLAQRLDEAHAGSSDGRSGRIPIVWDSVDCISHLFEQAAKQSSSLKSRLITRLELGRTRVWEGRLLQRFDRVTVTSPVDRTALLRLAEASMRVEATSRPLSDQPDIGGKVEVLPNGVDLDYFAPRSGSPERAVALTGKMSYHANVTAALHLVQDIMPQVWSDLPDVEVWLVGKDPPSSLQALAIDEPRVVVTGTVPDMRERLWRASVSVAPMLYGAGIQNKVMEAMACGTPVVASPQGVSALQATPGRDLLVADGANAFAAAVKRLIGDSQERAAVGAAGRSYVEEHHSWDAVGAQLEAIYRSAVESPSEGRA